MQRKRFLLLALAVLVVGAAAAAASIGTMLRTEANAGTPAMELQVAGTGVTGTNCNVTSSFPEKCSVPLNGTFNLEVHVVSWPPDPDGPPAGTPCVTGCAVEGYAAMATDINWTGTSLIYTKLANSVEVPWPQRGNTSVSNTIISPTNVQHGDLSTGTGSTPSTFKGVVVRLQFTCTAGPSTNLVSLVPQTELNPGGAALADHAAFIFPTPDQITINCGSGGASPTATATTAPPTATTVAGPTSTPAPPTATTEPGAPTNTPPAPTNTVVAPPTATRTATLPPPPPTATPLTDLGDVNKDGEVDSIDASLVLQHEAGLIDLSDQDSADVNRDGEINSVDALFILWVDAGLISL